MTKLENYIDEHITSIRTANDHAAMRIVQGLMYQAFIASHRGKSIADMQIAWDNFNNTFSPDNEDGISL